MPTDVPTELERLRAENARLRAEIARLRPPLEDPCVCVLTCTDRDPDGAGMCKGLPYAPHRRALSDD